MQTVALIVAAIAATVGVPTACKHGEVAGRYERNSQINPQRLPYSDAYFLPVGIIVETVMSSDESPGAVDFALTSKGTLIDVEHYRYDETSFNYIGNDDETFEPGIPLLKYPFSVGDEWKWSGLYKFGGKDRKASAKIKTTSEVLNTVVGQFSTIKVTADLEIESGIGSIVQFPLVFWIAPDKGIIKREFPYSGTREPMPLKTSALEK